MGGSGRRTTVSVTKGIGSALLGGRGGVTWWTGGESGTDDMQRILLDRKALRNVLERAALNTDLDTGSIGCCVC